MTVEARRQRELLERQINSFASEITLHSRTESLARWQVPVCLLVAGLPRDKGEFVLEHISQIAQQAGVPPAVPDCTPNFLVVMTRDPQTLLRQWWAHNPGLFNRDRGVGGIEQTIDTDQPVRVFYNACSVPPSTKKFTAQSALACGSGALGSRLTWEAVRAIYSVIVVIDVNQTKERDLGSLADYSAMVGLAQIRRNAALGTTPTVLRLFAENDAEAPSHLTGWDQTFLKSLYATNSGDVAQLSEVKRMMRNELAR